jgi:hypothetical protein
MTITSTITTTDNEDKVIEEALRVVHRIRLHITTPTVKRHKKCCCRDVFQEVWGY